MSHIMFTSRQAFISAIVAYPKPYFGTYMCHNTQELIPALKSAMIHLHVLLDLLACIINGGMFEVL